MIYIYTDASFKPGKLGSAGVVVKDHHIIDIYYANFEVSEHCTSVLAEALTIRRAVKYVKEKYNTENIIVYSDCRSVKSCLSPKYGSLVRWVKGHTKAKDRKLKHKFNCLADFIATNSDSNWKEHWHNLLFENV